MIIDCHMHVARELTGFWQPLRLGQVRDRGRVRQAMPPAFDPPACPPELALAYMDQVGVERAFLVQHHLYGNQNATVLDAVRRWPDRFSGLAYLGPMDQPDAPAQLASLLEGGMAGLKIEITTTRRLRADFRFDGEREWRIWERLQEMGGVLVLDLNTAEGGDVEALWQILDAFPRLRMTICHVGGAPRPGWKERAMLAEHPRVWLDIASLQPAVGPDEEYPCPGVQQRIRWAVDRFGAQKVMWGTDWPGALNWSTYRQHLDVVRRHCAFMTAEQKEYVLGRTALRFLDGSN